MFYNTLGSLILLLMLYSLSYYLVTFFKLPKNASWLPGPTGFGWIGRVWDIPRDHGYKRFKEWSDQFGPIYQINIFGNNHVWLASDKVARDLLVTRSQIFSDRPPIMNLQSSKHAPEYLPLLGFNDAWARQRKFVHSFMSLSAAERYKNLPYMECKRYLVELLMSPRDHEEISESFLGRVTSRLAYGDDRFDPELRRNSHALLRAISPAANLPNVIPQLAWLPYWLSPWKIAELARHEREREFFVAMCREVEQMGEKGHPETSFMRNFLENREKLGMNDLEGAYVVGMISLAGMLTTASALMTYILVMCLHPEWQRKVQEEIDHACGDRMPSAEDSANLPVLRAVIKEIIRWRPVAPSSIPHESTEDCVYEGFFIPKGTYVHPNQWAITRDASVFPDPELYNPARWLDPSYPSYQGPLTKYPTIHGFTTFGYGRRACMGQALVEHELLVGIGAMAWAFDVSKKRDLKGAEIAIPRHNYTSLIISRPRAFDFDLRARSTERRALVWKQYEDAVGSGEIGHAIGDPPSRVDNAHS